MTEKRRSLARKRHHDILDDKHPDRPARVEEVHGILMEFVEVKCVDPLLCPHQDVLVVRLRMHLGGKIELIHSPRKQNPLRDENSPN